MLQNLISQLGGTSASGSSSNTATAATSASAGATSAAVGGSSASTLSTAAGTATTTPVNPFAQLQQDFQTLVGALDPSGANSGAAAPTLVSFLQNLVSDLGGTSAGGISSGAQTGSLLNTSA